MPSNLTYPGVYIEEVPSGVRTITGVSTSVTAFVGRTFKGPDDEAILIHNFSEFERIFGGLWKESNLGYVVDQYFGNGGRDAIIIRVHNNAEKVQFDMIRDTDSSVELRVRFIASNPGRWAANLIIMLARKESDLNPDLFKTDKTLCNVEIYLDAVDNLQEKYINVSLKKGQSNFIETILEQKSQLIRLLDLPEDGVTFPEPSSAGSEDLGITYKSEVTIAEFLLKPELTPDLNLKFVSKSGDLETDYSKIKVKVKKIAGTGTTPEAKFCTVEVYENGITDAKEAHQNVSLDKDNSNFIAKILENDSQYIRLRQIPGKDIQIPEASSAFDLEYTSDSAPLVYDGGRITAGDIIGISEDGQKNGLFLLDDVDIFNILCIPDLGELSGSSTDPYDTMKEVYQNAEKKCQDKRAFLLVDPPANWETKETVLRDIREFPIPRQKNAAIFFPWVKGVDSLNNYAPRAFPPCGVVAGTMARTDSERGVWKASAGMDSTLNAISGLNVKITDEDNGNLNKLGINCLRTFFVGPVIWGARTLRGDDRLADEWKYIPVRRTALFIEESLYRGTQWVVFEPNDEKLWSQIRLNVGAFMHDLFMKGAFQGTDPKKAYFVKCDSETTTQPDIDRGIVNILVGFAPLKPAEFVVLKLQQISQLSQGGV